MRKIICLFAFAALVGCASKAQTIDQQHLLKTQELDAQYQAGQIDSTQYQMKYFTETQNYNQEKKEPSAFKKIMSFLWDAHMQKSYGS